MQKEKKEIHIVFQVINFIHSDLSKQYDLLPVDKLILINLASHKGPKGICPSTVGIAQELNLNKFYVERRLAHLEIIGLLKIVKNIGKRSHYNLNINFSSGDSQVTTVVTPRIKSGDSQVTRYNKEQLNNNREREALASARSSARSRSPLSLSFFSTNEKLKAKCKERNLDFEEVCTKFINYVNANGKTYSDPNAALENWILNEKPSKEIKKQEVSRPFYEIPWCNECERNQCVCFVSSKEHAHEQITNIMAKLKSKMVVSKGK